MKYAIIEASGTQYIVHEGKPIDVMLLEGKEGSAVTFSNVLLIADEKDVVVGMPHVAGGSVSGEVVRHYKGDKVRISHFTAKSRYHKVRGFRPQLTQVMIKKIAVSKGK